MCQKVSVFLYIFYTSTENGLFSGVLRDCLVGTCGLRGTEVAGKPPWHHSPGSSGHVLPGTMTGHTAAECWWQQAGLLLEPTHEGDLQPFCCVPREGRLGEKRQ